MWFRSDWVKVRLCEELNDWELDQRITEQKRRFASLMFHVEVGEGFELASRGVIHLNNRNKASFLCLTGTIPSEKSSSYVHSEAQKLSGPCCHQEGELCLFVCYIKSPQIFKDLALVSKVCTFKLFKE